MSEINTVIIRFMAAKLLTLYHSLQVILFLLVTWLKNPFRNPWSVKLKLEPPARLTDPKYGTHKYLKANNIKLHYVESGDPTKPLMLFVHGFPELWYSWRHQIVNFQKDYWCIAIDMRGYGDSEKPEGIEHYKLNTLAADLRDLVRQLGREKFILVAHDWGGVVSCRYRDLYPESLSAVVVLSGTSTEAWLNAIWTDSDQRKKSGYVFLYLMPVLPELLLQSNDLGILDTVMLVKGKQSVDLEDLECFKYWLRKQGALTPPINYYRANFGYSSELKPQDQQPVPFLFAHGSNEKYLNAKIRENIKTLYQHVEIAIIEDSGHFTQQEDPEKVNKLIRDFLAKQNL
ncbi:epoxide hydrolase 3-like [Leptidea sinapis]|uniref:epoxide hydrolase 3-like n=1 Tax=Leptidea sinapis TaxID=189913 RepID=UPI002121C22D|nr:epoxide hydrolase 3-like [Leptidea sinapis]